MMQQLHCVEGAKFEQFHHQSRWPAAAHCVSRMQSREQTVAFTYSAERSKVQSVDAPLVSLTTACDRIAIHETMRIM